MSECDERKNDRDEQLIDAETAYHAARNLALVSALTAEDMQIIERHWQAIHPLFTMLDRVRGDLDAAEQRAARTAQTIDGLIRERDAALQLVATQKERINWLLDAQGGAAHDASYVRGVEAERDAARALAETLTEAIRAALAVLDEEGDAGWIFAVAEGLHVALAALPTREEPS